MATVRDEHGIVHRGITSKQRNRILRLQKDPREGAASTIRNVLSEAQDRASIAASRNGHHGHVTRNVTAPIRRTAPAFH